MASSEELSRSPTSREEAEQAAAAWIARRGTPDWTPADTAAFDAWLSQSVSHRAAYYRLNAAWEEVGRLAALTRRPDQVCPPADPKADADVHASRLWRPRKVLLALAAGLVLALVGGSLWFYRDEFFPSNRYATVVGGLEAVPLSDGSRVTLNTDSALRVALTPKERDVDLERGEAFFEVAKDPRRPFVVNAGRKRVVAVGTQFSVFREGEDVRVTVAEGTVRLEDRTGDVLLPAGSVARAEKNAVLVRSEGSTEIQQQLSWRSGQLTFRDTPLADAAAEFNRYNERKIVIGDPAIATLELGGVFRATDLDPFIALLEQGFPVRASVEDNRIVLTHN